MSVSFLQTEAQSMVNSRSFDVLLKLMLKRDVKEITVPEAVKRKCTVPGCKGEKGIRRKPY